MLGLKELTGGNMKEYAVKHIVQNQDASIDWDNIQAAVIDCYPWDQNGYKPFAEAKLAYTRTCFHIRLKACENRVKAVYDNINDPVYKDSCMEFFFNAAPDKEFYLLLYLFYSIDG